MTRRRTLLMLLAGFCLTAAPAQEEPDLLGVYANRFGEVQEAMARKALTSAELRTIAGQLAELSASAEALQSRLQDQAAEATAALDPAARQLAALEERQAAVNERLEELGAAAEGEDKAAADERAALTREASALSTELGRVRATVEELREPRERLEQRLAELDQLRLELAAAQADLSERLLTAQTREALDRIEAEAAEQRQDPEATAELLAEIGSLREEIAARVEELTAGQSRAAGDLEQLGEPTPDESPTVKQTRQRLAADQRRLESALSDSRLNQLQAEKLAQELQARLQSLAANRLLERDIGLLGVVRQLLGEDQDWGGFLNRLTTRGLGRSGWQPFELGLGLAALLLAVLAGHWLRPRLHQLAERPLTDSRFAALLLRAALVSLSRHAPWLLFFGTLAALTAQLAERLGQAPVLTIASYALFGFIVVRILNRTLLAPYPPAASLTPLTPDNEIRLARLISVLTLLGVFGYLLFRTAGELDLPVAGYLFARALFVILLTINLAWLLRLVGAIPRLARIASFTRWVSLLLLSATILAELVGYRNLSYYLLRGVLGTLLLAPLLWVVRELLDDLLRSLTRGAARWQQPLRRWLDLAAGQPFPGLGWLRFLAGLLVWWATILLLARIWSSAAGFANFVALLREDIHIGDLAVAPDKLLFSLLLFGLFMVLSHGLRTALDAGLERRGRMDQGARTAVITIVGYLGVTLAALIAFTTLGLDMAKLAVVFGALSVGIGFGLQNIVNNFVSGLILLFERPIRVGDWIRVGESEGIVSKLSVRSTELQTFAREDLIIPNSELITQTVTNMMRHNVIGRVTVEIGVAYDSDPEQVRDTLLEIAAEHDNVKKNEEGYPLVIFRDFGDSALKFQLYCILEDVGRRLTTLSDLHYAVYRKFKERGIIIPFPQRDVWLRQETGETAGGPQE